jgi:hypothetical protein
MAGAVISILDLANMATHSSVLAIAMPGGVSSLRPSRLNSGTVAMAVQQSRIDQRA